MYFLFFRQEWWHPGERSSEANSTTCSPSCSCVRRGNMRSPATAEREPAASEAARLREEESWPQFASRNRRGCCASPMIPEEELTSMLCYFDEKSNKDNKMYHHQQSHPHQYMSDYQHHGGGYHQSYAFLPNVSPSTSSLDSGYCGPASVESSGGSHMMSPWTPPYYMDPCSPAPSTATPTNNNSGMGEEYSHRQAYDQTETEGQNQEDISQIVDQVLKCIEDYGGVAGSSEATPPVTQFSSFPPSPLPPPSSRQQEEQQSSPDELATLCHTCGERILNKTETCTICASDLTSDLPENSSL